MATVLNYNKRNFYEIKDDIKAYIKQNYPDVFQNLDDNSVGSVFVDILAGSSEMLYFNLDRTFQETQLENAQLKKFKSRNYSQQQNFNGECIRI